MEVFELVKPAVVVLVHSIEVMLYETIPGAGMLMPVVSIPRKFVRQFSIPPREYPTPFP
jgi:hypothetical protein